MPSFFSRLKGKDGLAKISKSKKNVPQGHIQEAPTKPAWEDAWTRKTVEPDEIQELLHGCTLELKSRGVYDSQISHLRCARGHASSILWSYTS